MDTEPEILASGPSGDSRWHRRWEDASRSGRVLATAAVALLACLAALGVAVSVAVHRGDDVTRLRAALARVQPPARAVAAGPAEPSYAGSAVQDFPDTAGGTFSIVATLIRPRPGAAPLTWLTVHTAHAAPGERYGLLGGLCGGEYVTPTDLASAVATSRGGLTIVAPDQTVDLHSGQFWVSVYGYSTGATLGGIQGPLAGTARPFRTSAPCSVARRARPGRPGGSSHSHS